MLIITNIPQFPALWRATSGETGSTTYAGSVRQFLRQARTAKQALFLVNCDPSLAFALSAALLGRARRPELVSVDLILRRPESTLAKLALPVRRFLLRRFDHHIHYFCDFSRIDDVFGIGDRSSFVPFKPNLRFKCNVKANDEGEYVLCFGRSLRDYDTFLAAMRLLPYPGALPQPNFVELAAHGARFTHPVETMPPNVHFLPDDYSLESQVRILEGAHLVVVPILKSTLVASGISTCLNAMLMKKCVIGSEGPGISDIYEGQIIPVAAEDPAALATGIRRAWEDGDLRRRVAEAGYRYALGLGGESEFYQRVIDEVMRWRRKAAHFQAFTPGLKTSASEPGLSSSGET